MDRFELQWVVYYQQGRKCGKADCSCAHGELHGPYWYARNLSTGRVQYLGRELPEHVAKARAALHKSQARIKAKLADINDKALQLETQANALRSLVAGSAMTIGQKELVRKLGFSSCLVQEIQIGRKVNTRKEQ